MKDIDKPEEQRRSLDVHATMYANHSLQELLWQHNEMPDSLRVKFGQALLQQYSNRKPVMPGPHIV